MKKSILILSVIGLALFMTSCLEEGSSNYADTTFVYLDSDDSGTMFGKTISLYSPSRIITSNSMITMQPDDIKILAYSWNEENGTSNIRVDGEVYTADNVVISDDVDVDQTILRMSELPEVEEPVSFIEMMRPLYANSKEFMGDKWIFQYGYAAESGKKPHVEFFKRAEENEQGEIAIDINLTSVDSSDSSQTGNRAGYVVVDMTPLRMYAEAGSSSGEKIKIRFYYYVDGDLIPSTNAYELTIGEN